MLTNEILSNQIKNNDFCGPLVELRAKTEAQNQTINIFGDETEQKIVNVDITATKKCIHCGQVKSLHSAFSIYRKNKDKYRNSCKDCQKQYARKRYAETKKYRIAKIREWQCKNWQKHKEMVRRAAVAYRKRQKI